MNRLLYPASMILLAVCGSPGIAAERNASTDLMLAARIEPFCRLTAEPSVQLRLIEGRAEIGAVSEMCNAAAGYQVRAEFTNLGGGTVTAGADSAVVDPSGAASFSYDRARRQDRMWALRNAVLRQNDAPIIVRMSITPL